MSKLNFSLINEAFILGSEQIKNTREEIDKLKSMLLNSDSENTKPDQSAKPVQPAKPEQSTDDDDQFILKLFKHPRIDDIIQKYIKIKHPSWILNNKNYYKESFGGSNLLNRYSSNIYSDMKNYITFFIISLVIYMFLTLLLNKNN